MLNGRNHGDRVPITAFGLALTLKWAGAVKWLVR